MIKVDLKPSNYSYYAFHPNSEELNARDKKIVWATTIIMGTFTPVIGHVITGIVYRLNKNNITTSRVAAKTQVSVSAIKIRDREKTPCNPPRDMDETPSHSDNLSPSSTSELLPPSPSISISSSSENNTHHLTVPTKERTENVRKKNERFVFNALKQEKNGTA